MVGVGGVPMGVSVGGILVLPAPAVDLRKVWWMGGAPMGVSVGGILVLPAPAVDLRKVGGWVGGN